jgi:hypothetical protein
MWFESDDDPVGHRCYPRGWMSGYGKG